MWISVSKLSKELTNTKGMNEYMSGVYEELTEYIIQNQRQFYRLAYSYVKEEQTALDAVQNAIIKALENYQSLRNREYLKTWFYRIVVNESLNILRKAGRELPCEEESLLETSQEQQLRQDEQYGNPETIVTQRPQELYDAILQLPETMQTVIKLYFFEELTLAEISEVTGVNLSTVKYRMYEGLKKLRGYIKEGVA